MGKRKQSRAKAIDGTRSLVALAARLATGGGTHGGGQRERNRRDRKSTRRTLREGGW